MCSARYCFDWGWIHVHFLIGLCQYTLLERQWNLKFVIIVGPWKRVYAILPLFGLYPLPSCTINLSNLIIMFFCYIYSLVIIHAWNVITFPWRQPLTIDENYQLTHKELHLSGDLFKAKLTHCEGEGAMGFNTSKPMSLHCKIKNKWWIRLNK